MPHRCKYCRHRRAIGRADHEYCGYCYDHFFADEAKLARLPRDHPFIKEREVRVQSMVERAASGLPLFDR